MTGRAPGGVNLNYWRIAEGYRGDESGPAESDSRAAECVLRRRLLGHHHDYGAGVKATRSPYFRSVTTSMADRSELCGQLSFHRDRLGQPSSCAPVCRGSKPEANLEKFRASVLSFARAVLDGLDGPYSIGRSTSLFARRSICARKCHVCGASVGDIRTSGGERSFAARATHDASAVAFNVGSFHDRDGALRQISSVRLGTGRRLFSLLSTAGGSSQCR